MNRQLSVGIVVAHGLCLQHVRLRGDQEQQGLILKPTRLGCLGPQMYCLGKLKLLNSVYLTHGFKEKTLLTVTLLSGVLLFCV